MAAVCRRQRAAGAGAVLRIGERRLRAKGDVRQVEAVPREGLGGPDFDAAAVGDRLRDDQPNWCNCVPITATRAQRSC
jgi:hypothetical protein